MVHIFTFCEKTLICKKENKSANFLCENLFKLNFIIDEVCIFPSKFEYESITFKNKDVYFFLMQKTSSKLNLYLSNLSGTSIEANEMLKKITTEYYTRKNIPMDKDAENEWQIPKTAIAITNPNGKTQGYVLKIAETTIFVLPNNYNEFVPIYNDCLLSYIEDNYAIEYNSETYKTFGLSEELLASILKDQIKNKDKVSVSIFSKALDNDIVIKAKKGNEKFDLYRQTIFDKLENYIYAVQSISMDSYLETLLLSSNSSIAVVGDVSINQIFNNISVDVINSYISSIFQLPNKKAKVQFGIDINQINQFGESSAEVAYSLAVKALEQCDNCDLVLSCLIGFENNKAVAYIALGNKLKIDIYKNQFFGHKQEIIENVTQTAKFYLIKKLKARDYKTL